MTNNEKSNPQTLDLSTLSREELIQQLAQERKASDSLLEEYKKMYKLALRYWIMSDLLRLRLYADPDELYERVGELVMVYAGWGEAGDVMPG